MTLTDRLNRATYLLDNGPDQPAVILLSYTWNDDALKWLALDADQRVELMLHSLEQIYPGVDIASHIVGQPITVSWEADPNFMGAFKANLPGHYRYQQRLFTHFKQDQLPEAPARDLPGRRRRLLHRGLGRRRRDHRAQRGVGRGEPPRRFIRRRRTRARATCSTRWDPSAWTELSRRGLRGVPARGHGSAPRCASRRRTPHR